MGYVKIAIYATMFYVYVKTYREWMKKEAEKLFFVSENKTNGYKQQKLFLKITNTIQELSHKLWMEIIVGILALKLSVFFAGKLCTLNEIDFFQFIDIMAN